MPDCIPGERDWDETMIMTCAQRLVLFVDAVYRCMSDYRQTCEPVSIHCRGWPVSVFQNLIVLSCVPPPDASTPCCTERGGQGDWMVVYMYRFLIHNNNIGKLKLYMYIYMHVSKVSVMKYKQTWCGDQAIALIAAVWSVYVLTGVGDWRFHTSSLLSLPPEAKYWWSGDHFSPHTSCVWPISLRVGTELDLWSHWKMALSRLPDVMMSLFQAIEPVTHTEKKRSQNLNKKF